MDEESPNSSVRQMHDIYHIAFLLRQKLVPDLIPHVMNYAEIFSVTTTRVEFDRDLKVTHSNAPRGIITSDRISTRTRIRQPVRKIVFSITAHDQGWASQQDQGSWTWFTARKITSGSHAQQHDSGEAAEIQDSDHSRDICRNPIANNQWHTHEVAWRADSKDSAESDWVSSLMVGDRVAVDAWAAFPGWTNYVRQASIAVHTAAIS